MKAMVDSIIAKDLHFAINESLHSIFNTNDDISLIFGQSSTLANDVMGTTTRRMPGYKPNGQWEWLVVDIELNANKLPGSSREYIASTVIHEALHAYFRYKYPAGGTGIHSEFDHYNMTTDYMTFFQTTMQKLFPGIDPFENEALGWGGLEQEPTFSGLTTTKKNYINRINDEYLQGTKGKKCKP